MNTVTLKSGTKCPAPLVATTMLVLRRWAAAGHGIIIHDAAMMARDSGYQPFGNIGGDLKRAGFMDGDRLAKDIADIIRCAVVGDGMDMVVQSPVQS